MQDAKTPASDVGVHNTNHDLQRQDSKDEMTGKSDPNQVSDLDDDRYEAGIRMRDLTESEVHQFPGLKRERWWYVQLCKS